jgi:hypothetical protein
MDPRTRSALLWGAVAGLTFLVLVQGYALVASLSVGFPTRLGVGVVVGVVGTAASFVTEELLARRAA